MADPAAIERRPRDHKREDQAVTEVQPEQSNARHHRHPRDRGTTFVELLVSIVLLGTVIISVLVALQATTIASTVDADHARAYVWLHNASDSVFNATRVACNIWDGTGDESDPASWLLQVGDSDDSAAAGQPTVWGTYNDAVASTPAPQGWAGGTIAVTQIEFLKPTAANDQTFEWGSACYEGVIADTDDDDAEPDDYRLRPLVSQKVTITVTSPDGDFTRFLETVKGDR